MTLTASEVFEQAMEQEFTIGDVAEAVTLYQAAATLYLEEGSPAAAETCEAMAKIAAE